jgi:hypothetical protein
MTKNGIANFKKLFFKKKSLQHINIKEKNYPDIDMTSYDIADVVYYSHKTINH